MAAPFFIVLIMYEMRGQMNSQTLDTRYRLFFLCVF